MIVGQIPILIFISLDGFMPSYLSSERTPNLFTLSKTGTMGNMESMFATKTFPNHFSMVTGLYEDEHQMINNRMFDPRMKKRFEPADDSEEWWNFAGTNMPIWIANQLVTDDNLENNRYSGSMMYPGSTTHYAGKLLPHYLKKFHANANYMENVEQVIKWITDLQKPANFVSMYFDQPDSIAHSDGPWGQKTLMAVERVDAAVGYLKTLLEQNNLALKTNLIIVSDHGMAAVRHVSYFKDLPVDQSKFTIHGMSPNWNVFVENPEDQEAVFRELKGVSQKFHFKICKRADIPPHYHYSKTDRVGDFLITVDENHDIFRKPNPKFRYTADATKEWGNHGWDPSNPDMRPLFMAVGPAFKQGYYHEGVFPNIDLFPLMVHLLDLPLDRFPNNGSLDRIIDVVDPTYTSKFGYLHRMATASKF